MRESDKVYAVWYGTPTGRQVLSVEIAGTHPTRGPYVEVGRKKYFVERDVGFHDSLKTGARVNVVIEKEPEGRFFGKALAIIKDKEEVAKQEPKNIHDWCLEDELEDF